MRSAGPHADVRAPLDGRGSRLRRGRGAQPSQRRGALWGSSSERQVRSTSASSDATHPNPGGMGIEARSRPSLSGAGRHRAAKAFRSLPRPALSSTWRPSLIATALERAVNEADKRDLIDPSKLRMCAGRLRRRTGVRPFATCSTGTPFSSPTRISRSSSASIATAPACRLHSPNRFVNGFEVDFHWPELGLVVETDGLRYHRTPAGAGQGSYP